MRAELRKMTGRQYSNETLSNSCRIFPC